MTELTGIVRLKIHDGKLEEYKRLAREAEEIVRTKDPGTLQYEVYINSDGTEVIAIERYRDSQSLIEHSKNMEDISAAILKICDGAGELLGNPTPELAEMIKGSPVQLFTTFLPS